MSDQTDHTISQLAIQMLDQMTAVRKLVANQNEALAGINALLKNHTQALATHQRIIEAIGAELGIAFDAAEPDAQSPAN